MGPLERPVHDRARRRLVATAAEPSGKHVAIEPAATAEAHLDSAVRLLDQDHRDLGALHRKREVDEVLGVGRLGLHFLDLLLPHGRHDHLAVVRGHGPGQGPPHEVQPREGVLLEELAVDRGRVGPRIDQPAGDPEALSGDRRKAKAPRVGREARVERGGDPFGERHAETKADFVDDPGRGLGGGVFEPAVGEVVLADVVVDHQHAVPHRLGHVAHRAQLRPGAGVEHDEQVAVGEVGRPHLLGERFDPAIGIDPLQIRGRGLGVDDPHVLANRLENARHPQFAAERVAVGTHVAREHHAAAATQHIEQGRPVESHHVFLFGIGSVATMRAAAATSAASWDVSSSTDAK